MGGRTENERGTGARAGQAVGALLAFLPALVCAGLVASHAVDVPVWDDWERAKLLEHSADGLDWAYLYSPHIDHRIVVPRLVALVNARLFGGDLTLEMGLSFAVVLATALCFHGLLRRTLGTRRPAALWGTTFLANALLFTPLQWENFLWAAQPFFLWPMGAVVAALLILGTRIGWRAKLGLSLALAIVTTHTFSHGLPIWVLVPAAVVLKRGFAPRRARLIFLGVWFAVAAAVLVPYFSVDGMRSTSEPSHAFGAHPGHRVRDISAEVVASNPLKVARFYAAMLGSPFARIGVVEPGDVAPFAGAAVTLLFAVPAFLWLRRFRDAEAWSRGLPWILLGGYGLGLCLLVAVGRSAMTIESYPLLPHYVSIAIYPLLAALPLGVLALRETAWRAAAPFAAGLLGVAIGVGWLVGVDGMAEWKSARLQARTALHFHALSPPHHRRAPRRFARGGAALRAGARSRGPAAPAPGKAADAGRLPRRERAARRRVRRVDARADARSRVARQRLRLAARRRAPRRRRGSRRRGGRRLAGRRARRVVRAAGLPRGSARPRLQRAAASGSRRLRPLQGALAPRLRAARGNALRRGSLRHRRRADARPPAASAAAGRTSVRGRAAAAAHPRGGGGPVSRARLLVALAAFSPLLASGLLVAAHAVEVPVWDDLERATLLDAWQKGTLDWTYLYSPHIESRMVVPRLITLINAKWFGGTLVLEHAVIFALVALTALAVHALLRHSFAERPAALWGLTFLANLLLLSPMHWETFLWAVQTGFVVPPLALVLSLWVLGTRWHPAARLAACALLCLAATWSHSYGVALWGVLFAYALLERGFASPRARALFLGAWALVSLAVLVPHFTVDGFRDRSDRGGVRVDERAPGPGFATLPDRAPRAALFGAAMLGSPLARTAATAPERVAPFAGVALGGAFVLLALYALAHFREPELWDRWLPWLALGGFAMAACLVAAVRHSALNGWQSALIPHYLGVSTYLVLATSVLAALLVEDLARRRPAWAGALAPLPSLALGALVGFHLLQWPLGVEGMREWKSARLQARTSILFLDHFEPHYWRRIHGIPEVGRRLLHRLDAAGFLRPPLLEEPTLDAFGRGAPLSEDVAAVKSVAALGRRLEVHGHAWLPDAGRRADGLLLAAGDRVLAVAEGKGAPRLVVAEADHIFNVVQIPGFEEMSPWGAKLAADAVPGLAPGGSVVLDLYAVDAELMRVHPLATRIRVALDPDGGLLAELLD